MNETNQLHALLSDMVAAYSSKKAPHIPTPAEIGAHLHPILDHMCADAEQRGASDIFISAGFPPSLKVNGTLTPVPHKSLSVQDTADIVTSTMNDEQLEEFNKNKDLNYAVQSRSNTRYRVNAYHDQGRVGLVLRRINQVIPTVEELSAAMVNHRNHKMPGHIVTIEDPIEYIYQPRRCIVTQREIGIDTPSWKLAVQNAMRQAPDVVCIGEVRNEDSMEYALQLAQTGHLCICTLHASTANQAIERIMNFYQEDRRHQVLMDVALNLVGIIGQRLVVKKDKKGRTAIIDLLINNAAVQDLIFKGELMGIKDIMLRSGTEGMQTFDQNLFELYVAGQVDYDEALRQADSANDLRLRIQLYEEGGEPERLFDRISDLNLMS